jgi:thiol-disulfide isomerase/thioredoxin
MKRSFLAEAIAYFFILLFLYTGAVKLTEIPTFRQQLSSSPLMGSLAGVITWALPIGEILLAIALFTPKWRLKALYATLILMTLFTGYVVTILLIDDQLTCSCGGIIEELSPRQHVLFNSACVVLALVGILITRRQQPTPRFTWLTGSSAAGLFILVGWLLFTAFRAPAVEKSGMEGRLIPNLNLLLVDSTTHLRTEEIADGKPFVVMGFAPWCKHCQALTEDIKKHIGEFRDTRIYYVTGDKFANMKVFYKYYKLAQFPNIVMGQDSTYSLFRYFHKNTTPLIAIYDAKRRLKRLIPGEIKAADLAKSLND